jgi:capsular exopolysaccharide synthesis family protein
LITLSGHDVPAAEAYRVLRTNLLYAAVDTPTRAIVLTSPGPHEGKSIICANLGVTLAQANKRTLIVDCDFRSPFQHEIFELSRSRGIANILAGECEMSEVREESLVPDLSVLPVGSVPSNEPAELLGSPRFAEVLNRARQEYEYVLVESPPTELASEALILASECDCVLLVIDSKSTRKEAARQSVQRLEAVGANVLGTVIHN